MKSIICFIITCSICFSCTEPNKVERGKEGSKLENEQISTPIVPTNIVRNIKQDRQGNIWVASWDGIFKYDGKTFINITEGVSDARFFSILEDANSKFWFSTIGSGIFYYDGSKFQNFTSKDGLANNTVLEMYEAKDKSIWFSTEGGVSKYDGQTFQNFTVKDGLPDNEVYSIAEDIQGSFWFGTKNGIGIYDGKKITPFKNEGKAFENVRMVIKDNQDNIWFGGDAGLWSFKDGKLHNYSQSFIGYIYQDSKGNILTISKGQGAKKMTVDYAVKNNPDSWNLSSYSAISLNKIDSTPEIITSSEYTIFGILEDKNGTIWYGTLDGVKRIVKQKSS